MPAIEAVLRKWPPSPCARICGQKHRDPMHDAHQIDRQAPNPIAVRSIPRCPRRDRRPRRCCTRDARARRRRSPGPPPLAARRGRRRRRRKPRRRSSPASSWRAPRRAPPPRCRRSRRACPAQESPREFQAEAAGAAGDERRLALKIAQPRRLRSQNCPRRLRHFRRADKGGARGCANRVGARRAGSKRLACAAGFRSTAHDEIAHDAEILERAAPLPRRASVRFFHARPAHARHRADVRGDRSSSPRSTRRPSRSAASCRRSKSSGRAISRSAIVGVVAVRPLTHPGVFRSRRPVLQIIRSLLLLGLDDREFPRACATCNWPRPRRSTSSTPLVRRAARRTAARRMGRRRPARRCADRLRRGDRRDRAREPPPSSPS